jgi:outer membrane protein OmpA-like peptidoglycan-associated protein
LNENPAITIEVSGHTDNVGSTAYNQHLSERRAQAVINHLITNGINPKRLLARGYGSSQPVSPNDTEQGRQQNRRIEFRVR